MNPKNSEEVRWFVDEVHPHELSLRSYLRGSFPAVRDVDDVVQESYLRMLRARISHPIWSARAFLFKVARHLAIDHVRRNRNSPIQNIGDLAVVDVQEDGPSIAEVVNTKEKIELLAEAIAALPDRCRQIIILRKIHGVPQRDVAARLSISEKTVEAQVASGIKRCEKFLRQRGVLSDRP